MTESEWTQLLCRHMRAQGAIIYPLVGSQYASGWPDRLVLWGDRAFLVEFKSKDGKFTNNQRAMFRRIQATYCYIFVARVISGKSMVDCKIQVENIEGKILWQCSGNSILVGLTRSNLEDVL